MRIALLSDVHGNADALSAVLHDADSRRVDEFVSLGDIVGYGAEPRQCLEWLLERCSILIAGNHDLAVGGALGTSRFNSLANAAVAYTRDQLGPDRLAFLCAMPLVQSHAGAHFVHASPVEPDRFPYLRDADSVSALFEREAGIGTVFYGHTHVPVTFRRRRSGKIESSFAPFVRFSPGEDVLCNVGSVGQPRDHDPRASYAIYDSRRRTLTRHRVDYDVALAAEKIRAAGLPDALGRRLLVGI